MGHRINGDRTRRARAIGYEYAHVAIDDATRVAYVEIRRSQRQRACAAFLTTPCGGFGGVGSRYAGGCFSKRLPKMNNLFDIHS